MSLETLSESGCRKSRRRLFWVSTASVAVLANALVLGLPVQAQTAADASAQIQAQTGKPGPQKLGPVKVEGAEVGGFAIEAPADQGYHADRLLSATKTDTKLIDVPQAVSVVTRQQMNDLASQSMADVVRYVPGINFAQGEGNRDTPIFRGNNSTSDFFVDGIRDDVQYYRDVYNIERVEVLKGPNAMIFGRGGVGGVINRVTRQANWDGAREVRLETGSDDHYRGTFDVGQGVTDAIALRMTGLYENSDSFRDGVNLERWGLNPTASFRLGDATLVQVGYEHFDDKRTADRGVPSYQGRPLKTDRSTFFGDPDLSPTTANVDAVNLAVEHDFGNGLTIRNRTRYANYDKFYQNVFPGLVNAAGTTVEISAYSNATARDSFTNQTDLTYDVMTGSIRHTLLAGVEYSRQATNNFRQTGYFTGVSPTTTTITVPVGSPTISVPITFRQSATDADNHGVAKAYAGYIQDQIELTPQIQAVLGVRYDKFDVDFTNNRNGASFKSADNLWSPRAGLVFKPIETVSLYASYSLTYLPRAGEQLASLSLSNAALDPEKFKNYELGTKWDVNGNLLLTAAVYQLDRSNVLVPLDPNNAGLGSTLVKGQRTKGVELGASGNITDAWSVIASYAYQDGKLTAAQSLTVPAGAKLANLPKHSVALWNRYNILPQVGAGVGVIYQSKRYTTTDNTVVMPDFLRVDAALYYDINDMVSAQLNVENLFNERYYVNANSNTNIMPGSPRAFRLGLSGRF
ncbi:TonB-dependent receptor [Govanella unica]|uniref:TonB-dependent siderophore receptor n=1 Tax=Govanella unica TaxID=2975056 RepID=A0A9X3TWR7_9PROT|nr:TonB-dependent siderophore receptor [Govania unica]MDA5193122.1 TonB-dependent siderophore receptor [Govania unica]